MVQTMNIFQGLTEYGLISITQKLFHIYQGWRVTIYTVKSAKETIDPVPQLSTG